MATVTGQTQDFTVDSHHPARAGKATMSKTADRVLGVHGLVIWRFTIATESVLELKF